MTRASSDPAKVDKWEPSPADLKWARTINKTIANLQEILRAEWPQAERYPSSVQLYELAVRVEILKAVGAGKRNQPKPAKRHQSELVKTGRKFLDALARIHPWNGHMPPDGWEMVIFDRRDINLRETTRLSVEMALAVFTPEKIDPARHLAGAIVNGWQRLGVPVSKGVKAGDPLCQTVTMALRLAGINYSPETVSDMLRDRMGRSRSGKARTERGAKSAR